MSETTAAAGWVIFDYGGVICRPQPQEDLARLAAVAGCPVAEFEDAYWPHRMDYDRADTDGTSFWQKVGAAVGRTFTPGQVGELIRLDIGSWLHLRPGMVALVGELADAGYRLALLSNAPVEVARAVAALPVARHFRYCAFSCDLHAAKPDPESYRAVLNRLGTAAPGAVLVDDRPQNVASAKRLGMSGILFTSAPQTRAALARRGIVTERTEGCR